MTFVGFLAYSFPMADSHVTSQSRKQFFPGKDVYREEKKWGEEQWIVNKEYCGKKLILQKDRRCSMHKHKKKDEVFYVQSGKVQLELGDETYILESGDFVHVPADTLHRFTGLKNSEIFEFSTHHEEEDSYRTELSGHANPEQFERLGELIDTFSTKKILVVGDVMLDRYQMGSVDRISPEAPIPVLSVQETDVVIGGAGNAAMNAHALGASVSLVGARGSDIDGKELKDLCARNNIRSTLVVDTARPTTTKERAIGPRGQQVLRLDREECAFLPPAKEEQLLAAVERFIAKSDAVLIADYAKGVLSPRTYRAVYRLARSAKVPVIVDPKPHSQESLPEVRDATVVKLNVKEARILLDDAKSPEETLAKRLSKELSGIVVLTRGSQGVDVAQGGKDVLHIDAEASEVIDVSGAGDTVAAVIALCSACGADIADAVYLGNQAAGLVVRKRGTATVSSQELLATL